MRSPHDPILVSAASNAYSVQVGSGLLAGIGGLIRQQMAERSPRSLVRKCAIISDQNVAGIYGDTVAVSLSEAGLHPELIILPPGEATKTLRHVNAVCEKLTCARFSRTDVILALGGGVIGDLAGFAAAIFLRGISYINVPTTVTAQCDSSIGGKTGVNTRYGKNLLGAFHPPALVVADVDTLQTLPKRIFNEGCAEIIKHAVTLDSVLFDTLHRTSTSWRPDGNSRNYLKQVQTQLEIVRRNVQLKADVVSEDEFEQLNAGGRRALLNFGHTIGHAIENAGGYGTLLHGEAVSLGMIAAARLSVKKAGLSEQVVEKLQSLLQTWELPTRLPSGTFVKKIVTGMRTDKKFLGGAIRFILLPALGMARISEPGEIGWPDLEEAVESLV